MLRAQIPVTLHDAPLAHAPFETGLQSLQRLALAIAERRDRRDVLLQRWVAQVALIHVDEVAQMTRAVHLQSGQRTVEGGKRGRDGAQILRTCRSARSMQSSIREAGRRRNCTSQSTTRPLPFAASESARSRVSGTTARYTFGACRRLSVNSLRQSRSRAPIERRSEPACRTGFFIFQAKRDVRNTHDRCVSMTLTLRGLSGQISGERKHSNISRGISRERWRGFDLRRERTRLRAGAFRAAWASGMSRFLAPGGRLPRRSSWARLANGGLTITVHCFPHSGLIQISERPKCTLPPRLTCIKHDAHYRTHDENRALARSLRPRGQA